MFYHITPRRNIHKILSEGLKPATMTGIQNNYNGFFSDPDYIYLWHKERIKKEEMGELIYSFDKLIDNCCALEISLDTKIIKVERDYDQVFYLIREGNNIQWGNRKHITEQLEHVGIKIIDFSLKGIKQAIDSISDESWKKFPGSYRTNQTIPPSNITVFSLGNHQNNSNIFDLYFLD